MATTLYNFSYVLVLFTAFAVSLGFIHPSHFGRRTKSSFSSSPEEVSEIFKVEEEAPGIEAVRAPLKFVGPYPCLALRFAQVATEAQRSKNSTGVSLDFVLDTAANVNTINGQVAKELRLEVVGEALPGVASSGPMSGGETFALGDAQLEGLDEEPFVFMERLTASAIPVSNPACAGLLGTAFFYCFEGGVEFFWGSTPDGAPNEPASVTFFGETDDEIQKVLRGMTRVVITLIPITQLPSVTVRIGDVEMPALLDTGSPITVLNSQAALRAGIKTVAPPPPPELTNNPFVAAANRFKQAQAAQQAASKGDILTILGSNGKPTNLLRSTSTSEISVVGESQDISFGDASIYVGDIPGLAALNGIGIESPPAVILGMDILRKRPKMFLRARQNEVYF